ncbi:MAG: cobalamin B12-binding domain-containing protein [Chloroflexi bacterium]|nr:cobalamin B12-binding domain-containing protein [Chloroflexota bacterium]
MKGSSIKKVLLINPPWYRIFGESMYNNPLGISYLAGVLEQSGIEVSIYNPDIVTRGKKSTDESRIPKYHTYINTLRSLEHPLWSEVETVIARHQPDLVGITVMTARYGSALNVSKIVKRLSKDVPVVWGGIHPTIMADDCLKHPEVDVVVRGEGEYVFKNLVEHFGQFGSMAGISYRDGTKFVHNPPMPLIHNLDSLPFPAKHLIVDKEKMPRESFGNILGARGCPFDCIFCGAHLIWSHKVRHRSPENVVREIRETKNNFRTNYFVFEDDTFTVNKKYVLALCDLLIKERMRILWSCKTRADLISDDLIAKMREAGCDSIEIGIESGSDETLQKMKKGITTEQVVLAKALLEKYKIKMESGFMFGFPWETKEDFQETTAFMKKVSPLWPMYSIVTPYPGTELYDMAVAQRLIPDNPDWSTFYPEREGGYLSKGVPQDEAEKVFSQIEKEFTQYTRRQKRRILLSHPWYVFLRTKNTGYFNIRTIWSFLRKYLWVK